MKNTLVLLLILTSILVVSCEKTKYDSVGTITGADMTLCACCGGYFIVIENTKYRFDKNELPKGFSFNDEQIPLNVKLNFELNAGVCSGNNWINITRIKKQ